MYAAIKGVDGTLELSTQVPPEALSPNQARALLSALEPLLATLRDRAESCPEFVERADGQPVVALPVGRPRVGRRPMASRLGTEERARGRRS